MAVSEASSSVRDKQAVKDAPRHDSQLDRSIEDSFPASDPPAVTQPAKPPEDCRAVADEASGEETASVSAETDECLDESLMDTFPASDPPAMTQPPHEGVGSPARPERKSDERRVADFLKPPGK